MDVRRLRMLREFALYGTVSAVAEHLHLTGPAVSQQLAALGKEVGVQLLVKEGRRLRLTSAGQRMVEHAEVILDGLAAAEADLTALRGGDVGPVRIAAFPSAARVLLPTLYGALVEEGRRLDIRVSEHEPDLAVDALHRGESDVAVVHSYSLLPRDTPPGYERHHLLEDPVLLALSPETTVRFGLAPDQPVHLATAAQENWLMPGPETSCHELTSRACGAAGFVPQPTVVATDFSVLAALVAAGAGVALIPRMALPAACGDLSLHPLDPPVSRAIYALVSRTAARHPQMRMILNCLRLAGSTLTQPAP